MPIASERAPPDVAAAVSTSFSSYSPNSVILFATDVVNFLSLYIYFLAYFYIDYKYNQILQIINITMKDLS